MDVNDAVIVVGEQLEVARTSYVTCARLVVRDKEIHLVGWKAIQTGDILIDHLSEKDLKYGLSSAKWNHIEERICDLILEGLL